MVKALYRRAQSHLALSDLVECEADLRRALLYEPGNKDVRTLFKQYKAQVRRVGCCNALLHAMQEDQLTRRSGTTASSSVQCGCQYRGPFIFY